MIGDAAGMIAPLCGNGMAMAIHSGKIVSDLLSAQLTKKEFNRGEMEIEYARTWNKFFATRLWIGRQIQHKLFGTPFTSRIAVNIALHSKAIANAIIKNTHGKPF